MRCHNRENDDAYNMFWSYNHNYFRDDDDDDSLDLLCRLGTENLCTRERSDKYIWKRKINRPTNNYPSLSNSSLASTRIIISVKFLYFLYFEVYIK